MLRMRSNMASRREARKVAAICSRWEAEPKFFAARFCINWDSVSSRSVNHSVWIARGSGSAACGSGVEKMAVMTELPDFFRVAVRSASPGDSFD